MRQAALFIVAFISACGSSDPGMGGTGGGSGGGSSSGGFACTTGSLFAGNPLHDDPMARPAADGTGMLEDPPLHYRNIVFSNGQLITHTGSDLWRANLTDKVLHRFAGVEGGQALITGPCSSARFANLFGMVLASDGSLFLSDQTANTILKVTDPLGPNCTVHHWSGTPMDVPSGITPVTPPNVGNVDGPGATAKFGLPERLTIDPQDNLYVWDNGNNSLRKIANDADHTTSTLAAKIGGDGGGAALNQAFLDGKVYVYGISGNDIFMLSVDSTGTKTDVFRGRADIFGWATSDSLSPGGMVSTGAELVVMFKNQLFTVSKTGTVKAIAGTDDRPLDPSSGYDMKASHPANEIEFVLSNADVAVQGVQSYVAIDSSKNLFVNGRYKNAYVLKLDCK